MQNKSAVSIYTFVRIYVHQYVRGRALTCSLLLFCRVYFYYLAEQLVLSLQNVSSLSHTRIHIPLGSLYRHLMTKAQLICMFSAPFITALFCANLYHNWAWGQQQLYIRTAQRPLRRVFFYAEMQIFRKHSVCQLIKVVWWLILTREDSFAAAHEIIYLLCLELLIEQYCSGICNSLMEIKKNCQRRHENEQLEIVQ